MSGPTRRPVAAGAAGAGAAAASSRQAPGTARRPPARPPRRSSSRRVIPSALIGLLHVISADVLLPGMRLLPLLEHLLQLRPQHRVDLAGAIPGAADHLALEVLHVHRVLGGL